MTNVLLFMAGIVLLCGLLVAVIGAAFVFVCWLVDKVL